MNEQGYKRLTPEGKSSPHSSPTGSYVYLSVYLWSRLRYLEAYALYLRAERGRYLSVRGFFKQRRRILCPAVSGFLQSRALALPIRSPRPPSLRLSSSSSSCAPSPSVPERTEDVYSALPTSYVLSSAPPSVFLSTVSSSSVVVPASYLCIQA